jgi:hypothetical protein
MNDFTKEELEIIYLNLCVNPKTHDILKKIEGLHQNYCEHELTASGYCKKCQRKI